MKKIKLKWILISCLALILIVFGIYRYYAYVMHDQWDERNLAMIEAKKSTDLVSVSNTQKSVWDENNIYWVLEGKNKAKQDVMVWVNFTRTGKVKKGPNVVHSELMTNGISKEKMEAQIKTLIPGVEDMRLLPGAYDGEYAWQLFYKVKDHYYYRFFRFSDGKELGTVFTLPNR
ncbi:cell wall elongation regulator TseB-like domain-containing protein [Paenibacillus pini]|uniref:Cell wall elongation regulator TseB-like domain-containing protein n=1 Tax=Paenibacillus pini JCM 16418 TaxID=1236976 RepID=W7Z442_9BACL|nr:DUF5590 domain-containing protein [Paenibacillus pini]GAF09104.1 hypothetical protein JCM16418_3223 [Paenibacillus pini JCM 16418]